MSIYKLIWLLASLPGPCRGTSPHAEPVSATPMQGVQAHLPVGCRSGACLCAAQRSITSSWLAHEYAGNCPAQCVASLQAHIPMTKVVHFLLIAGTRAV